MLGVLGGMGPMATVDFMKKVVEYTPSVRDQDHIPMLVYSACQIPDRTAAILNQGQDPFPFMLEGIHRLDADGASIIAIPCNTAHFWYDKLQAETETPIVHIVDAVIEELHSEGVLNGRIGLLATDGTLKAQIYQNRLSARGYSCEVPVYQHLVTEAIHLVKSGQISAARTLLERQARVLLDDGCTRVVLACTEIPVALAEVDEELDAKLVDSTKALALASINRARKA